LTRPRSIIAKMSQKLQNGWSKVTDDSPTFLFTSESVGEGHPGMINRPSLPTTNITTISSLLFQKVGKEPSDDTKEVIQTHCKIICGLSLAYTTAIAVIC
jgi:hypothetical protein